jgi:hypothetical protein
MNTLGADASKLVVVLRGACTLMDLYSKSLAQNHIEHIILILKAPSSGTKIKKKQG